jgi:hypothetical protein
MHKIIFVNGATPYSSVIERFGCGWRMTGNELDLNGLSAIDSLRFRAALSEVDQSGFHVTHDYSRAELDSMMDELRAMEVRLRGDRD